MNNEQRLRLLRAIDNYREGSEPASVASLAAAMGDDTDTVIEMLAQASADGFVAHVGTPVQCSGSPIPRAAPGWILRSSGREAISR